MKIEAFKIRITVSLLPLLLFNYYPAIAQQEVKEYYTQKVIDTEPRIDGALDDDFWKHGEWEGQFTQNSPDNGNEPMQATEFKILYNNNYIFVAIRALDTEPNKIDKRMARRNGMVGDRVAIEFDSYYDKRTSFMFGVNAAGVKNDGIITRQDGYPDLSTDLIWYVKTKMTSKGWNAEMKIPLSQLRFNSNETQKWGLQVVRFIFRNQEYDTWQHVPDSISGWVRNYGELKGITNITPKKQIEIAPYALTKVEIYEKEEGNPFADGKDFGIDAGLDGKIGITNDLTLDFAINPDFGQVEADPSNVNLTAFETYYPEKRPFFIEGKNITNYKLSLVTQDNLFYSRRIGRAPQGKPAYNAQEYLNMPERVKILGAVKLSGKTQNGWSVGIIENITNQEKVEIDNNSDNRKEVVEPYTNYFLTRVQKDINKGNTIIGGIVTSVYRNINSTNIELLNTSATTGGVDFKQYFKNRKYSLSANITASHIKGSKEALLYQQTSARRYYQRPGYSHFELDSNRTSLSGHGGNLMFEKFTNTGFNYGTVLTWRSPGYELNDIGYLKKADYIFQDIWTEYIFSKPFSIFRRVSLNADVSTVWDFSFTNNMYSINTQAYFNFKNMWDLSCNLSRTGDIIQTTELRGGPALHLPGYWEYWFMGHTSSTKKFRLGFAYWQAIYDHNSRNDYNLLASLDYRPINSVRIYLSPGYDRVQNSLQYVSEESFNNNPRYIMSNISQETFYFTFRVDYNLSPDLTVQYYAMPFISGGLYTNFKRITNPKANTYSNRYHEFSANEISYSAVNEMYAVSELGNGTTDYSFYNPDFNFKQFRSNLVLRWEYKAGSAVYLVWSQNRTGIDYYGDFDIGGDFKDLFKVDPYDVIMLKFSYRFMN